MSNNTILKLKQNKNKSDEYFTSEETVLSLLPVLPDKNTLIWEPTDIWGNLNITNVLLNNGYEVYYSGLPHDSKGIYEPKEKNEHNFLVDKTPDFKGYFYIVTNPPFSKNNDFISRCITIMQANPFCRGFSLLMPLSCICGQKRKKLWEDIVSYCGVTLYTFSKRVKFIQSFDLNSVSTYFEVAWFSVDRFSLTGGIKIVLL